MQFKKISDFFKFKTNNKMNNNKNILKKNLDDYIIEVYDLSKTYFSNRKNKTEVLKSINLKIKKGDFVVLFGKSGSGKSTLLNIMSGLDKATSGDVIVCDNNLSYLSNHKLTKFRRDNLAFIFQQYHLLNNITGYENVEIGKYLQKDKNKLINIEEYFQEFDLLDVMNKYPSQMSGGQQQRISIVRALAKNADIIFADEPTGALDKKTSSIVLEMLKKINKEQNKTIIMVSHDPDVAKYANHVIMLENGNILKEIKS